MRRLAPLPQLLAIAGMAWVIVNAAPVPELERPVFTALGSVLGLVLVQSAPCWVKLVMRRGLFSGTGSLRWRARFLPKRRRLGVGPRSGRSQLRMRAD